MLQNYFESLAARAMLLVMMASVSGGSEIRWFRFGADEELVDAERAVEILRNLPKPVSCGATLESGVLTITCGAVRDADMSEVEALILKGFEVLSDVPVGPVLLKAGAAELILSPEAVNTLRESYRISSPYGLSGDHSGPDARNRGAVWVIEASAGGEVLSLDQLDEPLRTILREDMRRWKRLRGTPD